MGPLIHESGRNQIALADLDVDGAGQVGQPRSNQGDDVQVPGRPGPRAGHRQWVVIGELRVEPARGRRDASPRSDAEGLIRQALVIGTEFVEGRHQFQSQVAVRALLFDYLWTFGLSTWMWAERSLSMVAGWPSLSPGSAADEAAIASMRSQLAAWPGEDLAIGGAPER